MVKRIIHKTNILMVLTLAVILSLVAVLPSFAANNDSSDVEFQVDVKEVLSVQLTAPDNWASGEINSATGVSDLLRNKINLKVISNNTAGFTASMYADNTRNTSTCQNASAAATALINCDKTSVSIDTLTGYVSAGNFTANRWGYSLLDTDAGDSSVYYYPLMTSADPIILATRSAATTYDQDIYFGAKENANKDAGTYAGTVVVSVVSGVVDNNNPVTPVNPATPEDATPTNPSYNSSTNRTVYTTTRTSGSGTSSVSGAKTTTITEVSSGDNRAAYAAAQGVTTSSTGAGSPLAIGLAVTAAVAAVSGIFFFIIAKRKKDDDDEEQQM